MTNVLAKQQIEALQRALEQRRAELRVEIREELLRSDDEHYIDLAGRVHDAEDESVADLLINLNLSIIDAHLSELREVEEALQRIGSGEYGVCVDCAQAIMPERLAAAPTTRRCVECQARHERTHRGYGGASL